MGQALRVCAAMSLQKMSVDFMVLGLSTACWLSLCLLAVSDPFGETVKSIHLRPSLHCEVQQLANFVWACAIRGIGFGRSLSAPFQYTASLLLRYFPLQELSCTSWAVARL